MKNILVRLGQMRDVLLRTPRGQNHFIGMLFIGFIDVAFWNIWQDIYGSVPGINTVHLGIATIHLPLAISRYWDFVLAPIVTFAIGLVMTSSAFKEDYDDYVDSSLISGEGYSREGAIVGIRGVGLVLALYASCLVGLLCGAPYAVFLFFPIWVLMMICLFIYCVALMFLPGQD